MNISRIAAFILSVSTASTVWSADSPTLVVKPTGRILMDGAVFASKQKDDFPAGLAIPEARLGFKMSYGNWSASLDASYSYGKIGLRNMWMEYAFNAANTLRLGNFIHQFGLQSTSSSMKVTLEQPTAATPFNPGLQLGAMFVHWSPRFYAAGSFMVENSALTQAMNSPLFIRQGFGALTRLVVRNADCGGGFWHAGVNGGFSTPDRNLKDGEDLHDAFQTTVYYPTKVVQRKELGASVENASTLFKLSPEFVGAYGRMAFEGEWYFQQINRKENLPAYRSQGVYTTLRGLLNRSGYAYSASTAQIATPGPGSLEIAVDWNYAKLSDKKAGIFGGRADTFTATLNWYINPYFTARLNWFHAHTWDRTWAPRETVDGFQARLMMLF